jgi:photosystem II stability/assembly factor-like uncharacterized protein
MNNILGFCFVCLLILASMKASAQATDWVTTNWTSSLYVQDIAVDDSGHVFAATYVDGVYRSTDDGDNWTNVSFPDTYVNCISINNSGHIFVGTWGHGLYRSTDNGNKWFQSGLVTSRINCIAINSAGKIFVGRDAQGGDSTLYRSTDNGDSWILCINGIPSPSQMIDAIATGDSNIVYASASGGVFRSTNNGDSWTRTGSASMDPISLLVTPSGHVFAGAYGVYRTTDNGVNWTPADSGCTTDLVRSLITNQQGYIFRGTASYGSSGGVYVSHDDGLHWSECTSGLPTRVIQKLAMNSAGILFAATFGSGVFRTTHSMTSVSEHSLSVPNDIQLNQNYPNPFNPSTTITFSIDRSAFVSLRIINVLGQVVATLVTSHRGPGTYSERWNAKGYSSGLYYCILTADNIVVRKPMILLK